MSYYDSHLQTDIDKYIIENLESITKYYPLAKLPNNDNWYWVNVKVWNIPDEDYYDYDDDRPRMKYRFFRGDYDYDDDRPVNPEYKHRKQSGRFWRITNYKYTGKLIPKYAWLKDPTPDLNKAQENKPEDRRIVYKSIVKVHPKLYSIRGVDEKHRIFLQNVVAEFLRLHPSTEWLHVSFDKNSVVGILNKSERLHKLYQDMFQTKYKFTREERFAKIIVGLIHLGLLEYKIEKSTQFSPTVYVRCKKTLNELIDSATENEQGVVSTAITNLI